MDPPGYTLRGGTSESRWARCSCVFHLLFYSLLTDLRERIRERGGNNTGLLFQLFMYSWLVLVCALTGSEGMRTTFYPTAYLASAMPSTYCIDLKNEVRFLKGTLCPSWEAQGIRPRKSWNSTSEVSSASIHSHLVVWPPGHRLPRVRPPETLALKGPSGGADERRVFRLDSRELDHLRARAERGEATGARGAQRGSAAPRWRTGEARLEKHCASHWTPEVPHWLAVSVTRDVLF